jgi:chromosome segregation ATPase
MQPVNLKTALFGFRRKQVLDYINAMDEQFQQQLLEQRVNHTQEMTTFRRRTEEEINAHKNAFSLQLEENQRMEQELKLLAKSLEEKYLQLEEQNKATAEVVSQLEESRKQNEEMTLRLAVAEKTASIAEERVSAGQQKLNEKDAFIAKQTAEVSRLQENLEKLEERFSVLQDDATQDAAMVNCLNLLQGRNRALIQKVSVLEAKLAEAGTASQVQEYTQKAARQQQAVKSTENLFAIVRQEMQDALDSISRKIELESVSEDEEQGYFVDMSVL